MLIRSKLIILLTLVICLTGVRVDAALSLEARATIEEIRARVNQVKIVAAQPVQTAQAIPTDQTSNDDYVPGKELRNVLAKYRTQIYGTPDATESGLAHWRVSAVEPEQLDLNSYCPGQMLLKALENYRTQRNVFKLVKTMKAKEVTADDDIALEATVEDVAPAQINNDNAPSMSAPEQNMLQKSAPANSSELLSESESALKISAEDKNRLAVPGSDNTADRTDKSVEKSLESISAANDKTVVEAHEFEFKMPRNYRVIVK